MGFKSDGTVVAVGNNGNGQCNVSDWNLEVPAVTTNAASNITTNSATLNMSYTMGEFSPVDVRFGYKKSADTTWTYTTWASKSAAGTHAQPLTGLDSNTQYDFRARLKYDSTEIQGSTLQFTTGKIPPAVGADDSSYGERSSTTLRSASMKVRYLKVTPQQVYINQPVAVTTNVINDGGDGSYNVMLRINGQVEQTQAVSVSGGTAKQVKFTVAKSQPGTYTVQVGNEKSMFTVIAGDRVAERAPMNEGLIVVVIFGALLLATVVVLLLAFRRRSY